MHRTEQLENGKAGLRAVLAAHYIATALLLVAVWSLVPLDSAYAYVDPSVMTYTIQAVAGVAVALSAVAGVAFRRTRRAIYRAFKIDENANKAVEPQLARVDPASPSAQADLKAAEEAAARLAEEGAPQTGKRSAREMPWRKRFAFALVMTLFMAAIVFIAPALEVYGANGDSLVFSLTVVWWVPFVFCIPLAIGLAALIALLKGRTFYYAVFAVFLVTVAAYVQSLFLNSGMMPADGGFINWSDWFFVEKKIVSGIVWIAIIAVPLVLCRFNYHATLKGACVAACAVMIVQAVGVASIAVEAADNAEADQARPYVTQGGLLSVSPKSNVVVFVLDTYDTAILDQVLEENPGFLDSFEDFTYFHNSLGTMIPTTNAIPNLLTGLKPEPGQDIGDYRRTKYERSRFLPDIEAQGYSIAAYSDSLMMDFRNEGDREAAARTINVHPVSRAPFDVWQTFLAMEQCALYRETPWVAKPTFWYYTSDLNNRMIAGGDNADLHDSLYELDDAAILDMIRTQRLQADDEGDNGAFRFIHLFGPHFPFSMNEEGENVGTNQSDQISQAKGSMLVVIEYLEQLKELGLYDQSTVIVTADHGVWYLSDDPTSVPISPIMLAKPVRTDGGARNPLARSEMPVSHDDTQPTVIAAMGGDSSAYGSTLFEVSDSGRVRYFDALTNAGDHGQRFVEYEVVGDATDLSCWEKTGNVWQDR